MVHTWAAVTASARFGAHSVVHNMEPTVLNQGRPLARPAASKLTGGRLKATRGRPAAERPKLNIRGEHPKAERLL